MITCTRRLQFCAGHRVYRHEGKCAHFHGHNYVALLTAQAPELDAIGRVIDFAVLKERIGSWIDQHWDHGFLYWDQDTEAQAVLSQLKEQKCYPLTRNPTAENLADFLLSIVCPGCLADTAVRVVAVQLWETENCYAVACL